MRHFGLIGHPLTHSFSKQYFDNKFEKDNIQNASFHLLDIPAIADILPAITAYKLNGFAVTIPYKQAIIKLCNTLSDEVKLIGAANCVVINNSNLAAHNTDIIGFEKSFIKQYNPAQHTSALILGTGGASKAVQYVFNKLQITYTVVSRQQEAFNYQQLSQEIMEANNIIVNCTPLGTYPNENNCPNIPYRYLTSHHYCFDMVYNPAETVFLQKSKAQKALTQNGYEMLRIQAEENWRLWTDAQ